jgi:uncharacterized protein (TIGR00251 family)
VKGRPGSSRQQKQTDLSATLAVRIQPRASKNGVTRMADGSLKIRLTAPPVDGAANEALVTFLSDTLSVGRSQVEIVSGHTGRQKIVRISGIDRADVEQMLFRENE